MEVLYGIDDHTVELVSQDKLTEIETNIFRFGEKVLTDTISKCNEIKKEFDNKKFNQTITNIQLGDACVDRWRGLTDNHVLMVKAVINYVKAL